MEGKDFKGLRALFPGVPEDLRRYVEGEILPRYEGSDPAHGAGHVRQVLENTGELLQGRGGGPPAGVHGGGLPRPGDRLFWPEGPRGHLRPAAAGGRGPGAVVQPGGDRDDGPGGGGPPGLCRGRSPGACTGRSSAMAGRGTSTRSGLSAGAWSTAGPASRTRTPAGRRPGRVEHIREKYGEGGLHEAVAPQPPEPGGPGNVAPVARHRGDRGGCAGGMDKTLYVSDLDGTLLGPDQRVSDFSRRRVINRLTGLGGGLHLRHRPVPALRGRGHGGGLPRACRSSSTTGPSSAGGACRETLLGRFIPPGGPWAGWRRPSARQGVSPLVYTLLEGEERVLWRPDRETPGVARYAASRRGDGRLAARGGGRAPLYRGEIFYFTLIGSREQLLPPVGGLPGGWGRSRACSRRRSTSPGSSGWRSSQRRPPRPGGPAWLKERLGCGRMAAFGDGPQRPAPVPGGRRRAGAVENALAPGEGRRHRGDPRGNREDGVARFLLADTAPALALGGEGRGVPGCGCTGRRTWRGLVRLFYETVHEVNLGGLLPGGGGRLGPLPGEGGPGRLGGIPCRSFHRGGGGRRGACGLWGTWTAPAIWTGSMSTRAFRDGGVASALAFALEGYARGPGGGGEVTVHASRTARPFFERRGYAACGGQAGSSGGGVALGELPDAQSPVKGGFPAGPGVWGVPPGGGVFFSQRGPRARVCSSASGGPFAGRLFCRGGAGVWGLKRALLPGTGP